MTLQISVEFDVEKDIADKGIEAAAIACDFHQTSRFIKAGERIYYFNHGDTCSIACEKCFESLQSSARTDPS